MPSNTNENHGVSGIARGEAGPAAGYRLPMPHTNALTEHQIRNEVCAGAGSLGECDGIEGKTNPGYRQAAGLRNARGAIQGQQRGDHNA